MNEDIKIVFGSDFHIGNSKISAEETHLNLADYFYPEIKDAQVVFLGGDFFHRLLKLDEPASLEAISIVKELIDMAGKYNFKLRVLRGTFTHDRLQNAIFKSVLSKTTKNVDVSCIDCISLELLKDVGLRVLYLPDNLPYKNKEEVMEVIHGLLAMYGWDKIDLIIGHGYFEHVFPVNVPHPSILFEYDDFKDIVTGYILMGHVHSSSVYKNIIYNGSFERFAHNEEEKKGFYTIYKKGNNWSYNFIENKDTPLFYTVELHGDNIDILQEEIDKFIVQKFNNQKGYLRIAHENSDIKQILLQCTHDKYPDLIVTVKSSKESVQQRQIIKEFQTCTCVIPTKENIPSLILEFLQQTNIKTELTEDIIRRTLQL